MILIVYGKEKEMFDSNQYAVPEAIVELYHYVKGGLDDDLFSKAIDGMVKTAGITDIVHFFNALACEKPIHTIYTQAQEYWRADDENKKEAAEAGDDPGDADDIPASMRDGVPGRAGVARAGRGQADPQLSDRAARRT